MTWLVAILGLGLLMIVHEAGHFFAARSFGLRVLKFSIGFGPTFFKVEPDEGHYWLNTVGGRIKIKLWKHDPEKHGPTVFQVAMIPFLAYVQIDGMNPFEEIDPDDKGSYANASLLARVTTIVAGPLANYVSASVFFFITAYFAGLPTGPDERFISPMPDRPAIAAGFQEGDEVVAVNGTRVHTWTEMSKAISSANDEIPIVVRRGEQELTLRVKPQLSEDGRPIIGVKPMVRKADFGAAAKHAVVHPTEWVRQQLSSIRDLFTASEEVRLGGPVAMAETMHQAAKRGWGDFVNLLGVLSTILAVFNLFPVPALDGGRLLFLGYEATTRKRANPTVEMQIHAFGFVVLLGLMIYVTLANDFNLGGGSK
jgi:regulator of sigma E protease